MAEVLIKAQDFVHPDPEKDAQGAWKRGMPVVVMPDGHTWGLEERLPKFVVLKLPGIAVDKARRLLGPQEVQDGFEDDGITPRMRTVRRTLWQLRWDELPLAVRQKIGSTGQLVIGPDGDYTWAQVRNFIRRNDTDAPADATMFD